MPSCVAKQRKLLKGTATTINAADQLRQVKAACVQQDQAYNSMRTIAARALTKAVLVMSWAKGGGMGGRPALTQALDKMWRSRALCDMPMSAACWKMTDVGSREGFTWTPLKKTVSGPCLHTLTCGHTLTSGQTWIGVDATMPANSQKESHSDAWTDSAARLWGLLCKAAQGRKKEKSGNLDR